MLVGDDGVVIVDTRSTRQGDEIRADLRRLTTRRSRRSSTPTCTRTTPSATVFRPAPIWGHVRCRDSSSRRSTDDAQGLAAEEPALADELGEVVCDAPDRVFEETAIVDAGGRRIELRYLGRGHTDNDIVVLVPDVGVMFAGDLIENGAPPYFGDGFPLDWPETASRVLELVRAAVVPGHGDDGDRAFVEDQLADFFAVAEAGRRVHRGEADLAEAIASGPYERFKPGASREAVERAVAQLRGELD